MKNLSEINKMAWQIRKNAALQFNCPVMEIVWGPCFCQARAALNDVIPIVETDIQFGTRTVTLSSADLNEWSGGIHTRLYMDVPAEIRGCHTIYIDKSKTARMGILDLMVETMAGNVICESAKQLSGAKQAALSNGIEEIFGEIE